MNQIDRNSPAPTNLFTERQTVRFQHCDPAGIVFYPRYYEMLNLTVERLFESAIGWSWNQLHKELHVTVPTVRIETDFFEASYMEDRLDFELRLDRLGRSSLSFNILCKCGDEERLKALITLVCIDLTRKKAVPWPDPIRARVEAIMANPPEI